MADTTQHKVFRDALIAEAKREADDLDNRFRKRDDEYTKKNYAPEVKAIWERGKNQYQAMREYFETQFYQAIGAATTEESNWNKARKDLQNALFRLAEAYSKAVGPIRYKKPLPEEKSK